MDVSACTQLCDGYQRKRQRSTHSMCAGGCCSVAGWTIYGVPFCSAGEAVAVTVLMYGPLSISAGESHYYVWGCVAHGHVILYDQLMSTVRKMSLSRLRREGLKCVFSFVPSIVPPLVFLRYLNSLPGPRFNHLLMAWTAYIVTARRPSLNFLTACDISLGAAPRK